MYYTHPKLKVQLKVGYFKTFQQTIQVLQITPKMTLITTKTKVPNWYTFSQSQISLHSILQSLIFQLIKFLGLPVVNNLNAEFEIFETKIIFQKISKNNFVRTIGKKIQEQF